jgi:hypothetical protein
MSVPAFAHLRVAFHATNSGFQSQKFRKIVGMNPAVPKATLSSRR